MDAAEPPYVLKGFSKPYLAPGDSTSVVFTLSRDRDLRAYREGGGRVPVTGSFVARVGFSSRDIRVAEAFEVPSAASPGRRSSSCSRSSPSSGGTRCKQRG